MSDGDNAMAGNAESVSGAESGLHKAERPASEGLGVPFRILSLDGGGSKGFYTLGVLREIEGLIGKPLHQRFNLVFGTSTGAIIAALVALGYSVDQVHELYQAHVPRIMRSRTACGRSGALADLTGTVFADRGFGAVLTNLGIVATRWDLERPMIFKSSASQAHGRAGTFVPGFGCTLADAVRASCSAYPLFERTVLKLANGDTVEVVDGGYCANNPTLFAVADAVKALKRARSDLRVVSVGVGTYPTPTPSLLMRLLRSSPGVRLFSKTLEINTKSMEQLRQVLFGDVPTVRICDAYERADLATDFMERDLRKLNRLRQLGAESFAKHEPALKEFLL